MGAIKALAGAGRFECCAVSVNGGPFVCAAFRPCGIMWWIGYGSATSTPRIPSNRRGAKAGVAEGAGARQPELPPAQDPHARPDAPHGLRGGPLPEHRGVLGGPDRDVHDPGGRLSPPLRLLRRDPW